MNNIFLIHGNDCGVDLGAGELMLLGEFGKGLCPLGGLRVRLAF